MVIDILFAIILVIAVYKGYTRGLIVAVFSFIAVMLGLAAALKLTTVSVLYAQHHWHTNWRWLPVICFIILFLGVILLVRLGASALQKLVELALLGWLNRLGGILLYCIIFTISYSILLWIANQLYWLSPETKLQSVTYSFIAPVGPAVIDGMGIVIPLFKDMFAGLQSFFDSAAKELQSI